MARTSESSETDSTVRNGGATRSRKRPEQEEDDLDPLQALAQIDPGEVIGQVTTFARANPHAALAGAAVVGFILGGGLSPRLIGALGMIAARRYMKTAMTGTLESVLK